MKTLDKIKELIQNHKDQLRQQYGLKEIGVFGSEHRKLYSKLRNI